MNLLDGLAMKYGTTIMMRWHPSPLSDMATRSHVVGGAGLGLTAISYVVIDYLRHISPLWHSRLQPALWSFLALVVILRVPFYKHWLSEFQSALPFVASGFFMLGSLLFESLAVRSITVVLGLDWHRNATPLPDTGQWLLLALNEKLPQIVVDILRARIIGLHHFLMLFMMLAFSVAFGSVEAPGLGLGARYMFTMGVGRLLRVVSFGSTILPSPRPWCAASRFTVASDPHRWAAKYYVPYADADSIRRILQHDIAYADTGTYGTDVYRPDWGAWNFLIDFLRPSAAEGSSWKSLIRNAGGGCNDLLYSGHMLVAVLTAMAWTEAYGGYSSAFVWLLVAHSAQREIRERHHYTVDCIVAIYTGVMLWKLTGFLWPLKEVSRDTRLKKLEIIQSRLIIQDAKDTREMGEVRKLLKEVELSSSVESPRQASTNDKIIMRAFPSVTMAVALSIVYLAFNLTSNG